MRNDNVSVDGARTAAPITEVIFVETKKILSKIGTLGVVGLASIAGAALWTNVLDGKVQLAEAKREHRDSSKVIVVDFNKAKKGVGL